MIKTYIYSLSNTKSILEQQFHIHQLQAGTHWEHQSVRKYEVILLASIWDSILYVGNGLGHL